MSAGFSEAQMVSKLADLSSVQQSIQTLSLWLIHHRKNYASIVKLWYREFTTAPVNKKLTFLHLANDVIQNSKKKGPEFSREFGQVLPKAFGHMSRLKPDEKISGGVGRLMDVWEQRGVFDTERIRDFREAWDPNSPDVPLDEDLDLNDGPQEKKSRVEVPSPEPPNHLSYSSPLSGVGEENPEESWLATLRSDIEEVMRATSPEGSLPSPPSKTALISQVEKINQAATGDASVRQEIANLPREVGDPTAIKVTDKAQAESLLKRIEDAEALVKDYTDRVRVELEDRKELNGMLSAFLKSQQDEMEKKTLKLCAVRKKHVHFTALRDQIKAHLEALPDFTHLRGVSLPIGNNSIALPSAADLFRVKK